MHTSVLLGWAYCLPDLSPGWAWAIFLEPAKTRK